MFIKRKSDGGSFLATKEAPKSGTGSLKNLKYVTGQVYHVPSWKTLVSMSPDMSQEEIDMLSSYMEDLNIGDNIPWAIATKVPVLFTQDREGNILDVPRISTRLYTTLDIDLLEGSMDAFHAPVGAKKAKKVGP